MEQQAHVRWRQDSPATATAWFRNGQHWLTPLEISPGQRPVVAQGRGPEARQARFA